MSRRGCHFSFPVRLHTHPVCQQIKIFDAPDAGGVNRFGDNNLRSPASRKLLYTSAVPAYKVLQNIERQLVNNTPI